MAELPRPMEREGREEGHEASVKKCLIGSFRVNSLLSEFLIELVWRQSSYTEGRSICMLQVKVVLERDRYYPKQKKTASKKNGPGELFAHLPLALPVLLLLFCHVPHVGIGSLLPLPYLLRPLHVALLRSTTVHLLERGSSAVHREK